MSTLPATAGCSASSHRSPDEVAPDDEAVRSSAEGVDGLRLVWATPHSGQSIQGAWWPRTRNITTELAELLPAADTHLGAPLIRLSLNPAAWDHQPRRLYAGKRVIRLAWFASIDPATVGIGATALVRITLCIIPPECPASTGQRILHLLRDSGSWPAEPADLLQLDRQRESVASS